MHYESLGNLAHRLLKGKARNTIVFAPNTIGKTRLAQHLKEQNPKGVMLYNALVEDAFTGSSVSRVRKWVFSRRGEVGV